MVQYLFPGCVVHILLGNRMTHASEALYFQIIGIKDTTFWVICQDTYRTMDWVGLVDGG